MNEQYKKDIRDLIRALEKISHESPRGSIKSFGDYSREEIEEAVFAVIKTIPRFETLTKEQFAKLSAEDDITALNEILNKVEGGEIPSTLQQMVKVFEDRPIGEASTKPAVTGPQTPEQRLRAALAYWEVHEAAKDIIGKSEVIEAQRAEEIKGIAQQKEFETALREEILKIGGAEAVAGQIAREYTRYVRSSTKGQNIATVDTKTGALKIPTFVEEMAKVAVLPLAFAADKGIRDRYVKEAKEKPDVFEGEVRQWILANKEEGREFTPRETEQIGVLAQTYRERIANLSPTDTSVPIINSTRLVLTNLPIEGAQLNLGANSELLGVALSRKLAEGILVESLATVPRVLPEFKNEAGRIIALPGINKITEEIPTALAYEYSPVTIVTLQTATRLSEKETAKENPDEAVGRDLFFLYGLTPETLKYELKAVGGLSEKQANTYIGKLKIEALHGAFPGLAEQIAAKKANVRFDVSRIFGKKEQLVSLPEGVYSGEVLLQNFHAQAAPTGLGGVVFNLGQRLFGGRAKKFLDRYINKAKAKAAEFAVKKGAQLLTKVGLTQLGAALGSVVPVVGTAVGAVIGWVAEKTVGLVGRGIKKRWGQVVTAGGAILGFLIAGPIGGLVGALGGAAFAGVDWRKWGNRAKWIAGIVLTYFLAKMLYVLIVTLFFVIGGTVLCIFVIYIINTSAYVVPYASTVTSSGSQSGGLSGTGISFPVHCSKEQTPLSFANSIGSPIAKRGWEIVSDLYQGFWCDWNRSPGDLSSDKINYPPSYPEIFDVNVFNQNPSPPYPGPIQNCTDCLFWCTWLIQKAYKESGYSIPGDLDAYSMAQGFKSRGKFISPDAATPANIVPGSTVYFGGGGFIVSHVALVYSANQDSLTFVQSNAGTKSGSLTFNKSGVGIQNFFSLGVYGFGTP